MPRKSARWKRGGRVSGKASNVERLAGYEQVEEGKGKTFDSRVDIYVINYRVRLADPKGISDKAAVDGCVRRGILVDDSLKHVREIREEQVKVKNVSEEKTLLIFVPVKEQ